MPRIILDTDPGIDDALAFCLAFASPEVQLEAITTVSGNVGVGLTTDNALALVNLLGHPDVPIARGCDRPLLSQTVEATTVHGENGLGGVILPKGGNQPVEQHAVDLIIERILKNPGEITLVAIGPLTNLALAVRREPRIAQLVREVVIMGGALFVPGNVTPTAEFNIYADPHAAQIVLHAGWPIRLVSLDVTTSTTLQQAEIELLKREGSPVHAFIEQALQGYFTRFAQHGQPRFQMHDPLCLAAAFQPELITWQEAYVGVELTGSATLGKTVAYLPPHQLPGAPNVLASVGVDAASFCALFVERINQTYK
ncbi:MAG TPA: nucleoside hydrolase [Ktedonobacteraceae bacterium]|nr:nucleoside hydrolase [Ktedonobacteraceae bacterium]